MRWLCIALIASNAYAQVRFLDGQNTPIDPGTGALAIALVGGEVRVTEWDGTSDGRDVRVEIEGEASTVILESLDSGGRVRDTLTLPLLRGSTLRTPMVRLVGDALDRRGNALRVALRDRVRARCEIGGREISSELFVGRPGTEDGPLAARRARARARVIRSASIPPVGGDNANAIRVARDQIAIMNEIWLQCGIEIEADVSIADAPVSAMIAISDQNGLPALHDGQVRLRAGGRTVSAPVHAGASPTDTALVIASALRTAGLRPIVIEAPRAPNAALPSADVLVRDARGRPIAIEVLSAADPQQRIEAGAAGLDDGLATFAVDDRVTGTIEERALVLGIADADPHTIDLLIVPFFEDQERAGEVFLRRDQSPLAGTMILDRTAIERERVAWTQAHELGHILLDDPFHAEDLGRDHRDLLMDADGSGSPRRLTEAQCLRARASFYVERLLDR
jgi:hypothetical protein